MSSLQVYFFVFTSPPPRLAFPAVYLNKSASARRLCGFQLGASVRLITSHTAGVCALSHACSDAPRCIHCQKFMHLDVQPGGNNLMTKQGQRVVGTNPYRLEGADWTGCAVRLESKILETGSHSSVIVCCRGPLVTAAYWQHDELQPAVPRALKSGRRRFIAVKMSLCSCTELRGNDVLTQQHSGYQLPPCAAKKLSGPLLSRLCKSTTAAI